MDDMKRFEQRLRAVSLREPSEATAAQLFGRAALRMRSQRLWRGMTVTLVAAAGLLLMINVLVGEFYAQRIAGLSTPPGMSGRLQTRLIFAENLRARKRFISKSLQPNADDTGDAYAQAPLGGGTEERLCKPFRMKPISIEALRAHKRLLIDALELDSAGGNTKKRNHGKDQSSLHPLGLHNLRAAVESGLRVPGVHHNLVFGLRRW